MDKDSESCKPESKDAKDAKDVKDDKSDITKDDSKKSS